MPKHNSSIHLEINIPPHTHVQVTASVDTGTMKPECHANVKPVHSDGVKDYNERYVTAEATFEVNGESVELASREMRQEGSGLNGEFQ